MKFINKTYGLIAFGALLLYASCKKNDVPPAKSLTQSCLLTQVSENNQSVMTFSYNQDKTISEMKGPNFLLDGKFSYSGDTIVVNYATTTSQILQTTITKNNSGQTTSIKVVGINSQGAISGKSSDWSSIEFSYTGGMVSSATITNSWFIDNLQSFVYNYYYTSGNLDSIVSISTGQQRIFTFTYDTAAPSKVGDAFWFTLMYGFIDADYLLLYPVQNKNLAISKIFGDGIYASPVAKYTYTYDDKQNISTMTATSSNGSLTEDYNYDCGKYQASSQAFQTTSFNNISKIYKMKKQF